MQALQERAVQANGGGIYNAAGTTTVDGSTVSTNKPSSNMSF